jgi:putative transposase
MTKPDNPFRYFNSSPEVIRLVVLMYVKFPLSLRNVEDLLAERENTPKVRLGSRLGPQPLQSATPPHQQRTIPGEMHRRTGRVAVSHGLKVAWVWAHPVTPETS